MGNNGNRITNQMKGAEPMTLSEAYVELGRLIEKGVKNGNKTKDVTEVSMDYVYKLCGIVK